MNTQGLEEFSASNDHMIVKGKRTRRPRPSSSASSDFNSVTSSSSTEEDEDLANCLILLARGPQTEHRPKAAVYVYECKTCNRTFSSFQALGGHRASHKKPKTAADFDQKRPPPPPEEELEEATITPPPSRPKIHECSICGSEFASGQALGGHMRRHRSALNTAVATADDSNSSHHPDVVEKARNMLSLDLNLPAPPEEEFRAFSTNQQPQRLMFAAAALVDCHY